MARGFEGIDQLISDLGELGREALPGAAARALKRGAEEVVAAAAANTPRRTGRAARSIGMEEGPVATSKRAWVYVGSALFYFPFIEYGGSRSPAYRPIGRAVDMVEPRIEAMLAAELDEAARRVNL